MLPESLLLAVFIADDDASRMYNLAF